MCREPCTMCLALHALATPFVAPSKGRQLFFKAPPAREGAGWA